MSWLWKWLAAMPSTNTRIFVTLLVFIGTAIRYWWTGEPPDREWMIFIGVMAGVDALQFGAKRATEKPEMRKTTVTEAGPPAKTTTTIDTAATVDGEDLLTPKTLAALPQDADEGGDDHRPPGPLK